MRILSIGGELTELGKRVERERVAKLAAEGGGGAAAATSGTGDGERGKSEAGDAEESQL